MERKSPAAPCPGIMSCYTCHAWTPCPQSSEHGSCSLPSPNCHCRSVSSVSVPSVHGEARSCVSPWFSWSSLTSCPPGCLCCLSLGQLLKSTLSSAHMTRKYNGVNSPEAILMQWEARKLVDSCFCLVFWPDTP